MKAAGTVAEVSERASLVYCFSDFRLDTRSYLLREGDQEIQLTGRAFDVLLLFLANPGKLLLKEEILSTVWRNAYVEESSLTVAISTLRRALHEDTQQPRFVQTVARRGYRFIAEVHEEPYAGGDRKTQEAPADAAVSSREHEPQVAATDPVEVLARPQTIPAVAPKDPSADTNTALQPHPSPALLSPRRARVIPASLLPALAIAVALLFAIAALSWWLLRPRTPIHSVAVLPSIVGDSTSGGADELTLLNIADSLQNALSTHADVRPTSALLRYVNEPGFTPEEVGHREDVDAVLVEGLDQSKPSHPQLHLRLVRARDGVTLWYGNFGSGTKSLHQVADEAQAAALREFSALGVTRHATTPAADKEPAGDLNDPAHVLYERGRLLWNQRTEESLRKSSAYFKQAIDANPHYAPAYAGLADSYALLASFSIEPGHALNADARSAALSAIELEPQSAEPHASLGMIEFFTDWDLRGAEQEFEKAIALDPNYATAHHWYALDLAAMGRMPEALYEIRLAQKLDPASLIIATNVGWVEYLARDFQAADADLHRVLELNTDFVRARTRLGMLELATGNSTAAIADLKTAVRLSGNNDPWVEGLLGDAMARAGDRGGAEKILRELQTRSKQEYVPPISCALVLLGLGRKDAALQQAKLAIDDHSTSMVYAQVDPLIDGLRTQP